jgi:hypothetical protein
MAPTRNNKSIMLRYTLVNLLAKINSTNVSSVSPCGENEVVHLLVFSDFRRLPMQLEVDNVIRVHISYKTESQIRSPPPLTSSPSMVSPHCTTIDEPSEVHNMPPGNLKGDHGLFASSARVLEFFTPAQGGST